MGGLGGDHHPRSHMKEPGTGQQAVAALEAEAAAEVADVEETIVEKTGSQGQPTR